MASFRTSLADPGTAGIDDPTRAEIRAEPAGKGLACRCPRTGPCHADVLPEIVNSDE